MEPWKLETVVRALPLGTQVRILETRPTAQGEKQPDGTMRWYRVHENALGSVVDHIRGYPEHDCPDHDEGSDECVCGGDNKGRIAMSEAVAVVAWESRFDDGTPGPEWRRCVHLSDKGKRWTIHRRKPIGRQS